MASESPASSSATHPTNATGELAGRLGSCATPPPAHGLNPQTSDGTSDLFACFTPIWRNPEFSSHPLTPLALACERMTVDRLAVRAVSAFAEFAAGVGTFFHNQLVESPGPLGHLYRIGDVVPSYPVDTEGPLGNGVVCDSTPMPVTFCSGCLPRAVAALAEELDGAHYTCVVCVPNRCAACDPRFYPRGHVEADFETTAFHIPLEWGRHLYAMQQFKLAHEKKNLHLGLVAYCERDTDARKEAFMLFQAKIMQLQRCPARCYPRWGALPIIRLFSPSWPLREDCARFATPWQAVGDEDTTVEEASHDVSRQAAQIVENDGNVPQRIPKDFDLADAKARGFTNLPDPGTFTPGAGSSVDGHALITNTPGATKIAPLCGVAVVHDFKAPQTNLHAAATRIGGPEAEARTHFYNPSSRSKGHLTRIARFLVDHVFTPEAVAKAAEKNGLIDFLCVGKLTPEKVRDYVNQIQSGFLDKDVVPAMTKLECTTKPKKAGRLVMNKGNVSFVASKAVLACCETILAEFDAPVNIKGQCKSDLVDQITEACSAGGVFEGPGALDKAWRESVGIIENDFGHFEYSQNAREPGQNDAAKKLHAFETRAHGVKSPDGTHIDEYGVDGLDGGPRMDAAQGLLFIERSIIAAVARHLPEVFNELKDQAMKAQLKTNFSVCFEGSVRTPADLFGRANWRLILHLLCRLSGDGQTSWGNRINNLVVMSVAHLDAPIELFQRLLEFRVGSKDSRQPRNWLFKIEGRLRYFRPWAEGDDFLAQIAGWVGLTVKSSAADVPRCKSAQQTLITLGLDASYFLHTSGRAEFVGVHILVERGLSKPKVWCPDVTRGLVKAGVGLSPAMSEASASKYMTRALAFQTRAMMFAGRVQPLYLMYEGWAQDCVALASDRERRITETRVDWQTASELGEVYGSTVNCGEVISRLQKQTPTFVLSALQQHQLVEASVGGRITPEEWSLWTMGGTTLETDDLDFLHSLPRAIQAKLRPVA